MFNVEKLQEIYNDLLAQRQVAIDVALEKKEEILSEKIALKKAELEVQFEKEVAEIKELVEKELIAEAVKPFEHDINLFEKALVIETDPIAE